ncbi:uncharacterized protein SCHCODRAFT_02335105 [Schizophyllum commune H4-8]|uniref:uncharacterized protein n=1 Tax=Schizophyllum commune (strain H4-8 / FGSC 9210) TaxID=578458 RepID=UPI00215E3D01|nr:uncharacterized protein SCHCODRAFT_02335105 [Schizophyllum commune H4-8]KAI5890047.1 hypothetical protein SCHCODRAFT_02335105 [Schizophyllum commune H4-8]
MQTGVRFYLLPSSMTQSSRCSSVQSFASADSMSISDSSSPEGAPAFLPAYTEMNGSSRSEHEDDTSSLQSHRFFLEDGNVRFQLEDGTLFNVHRYFFKKHAPSFAAEYLRDVAEEAIKLPGVTTVDFERFLTMIYPSEIGERDIETVDEWTSVLRLATKWCVPRLRALAIREIEPKATPIEKIVIAREFDLGKDWLLPSFTAICTSSKPLDYDEAERLGLRTVVDIARIREARCRSSDRESTESEYDVASAVLASSVLVPTHAGDSSPPGNDDTVVVDDLMLSTPQELALTANSSSLPTSTQDANSSDSSTPTQSEPDTPLADEENTPQQADEVSGDETAIPESLWERALYALKLERPAENEQPETTQRRRERLSEIVNGILEGNPRTSVPTQIEITADLSQDNALRCTQRGLGRVIAQQIFLRLEEMGGSAKGSSTDGTSLTVVVPKKSASTASIRSTLTSNLTQGGLIAIPCSHNQRLLHVAAPQKQIN